MKLDLAMAVRPPRATAKNPFPLGWRYVKSGGDELGRVPLTEEDLVYPAEEDFVVNNLPHLQDREYLMAVLNARIAGREGLRLLGDHLIDFETPAVRKYLGPDVILFNGDPKPWDGKAVFPVRTMKARPLFAIEITSPTTRRKDLTDKFRRYYKAGVPVFVLIDLPYGGGKNPAGIVAFQAGPKEYEPLPPDEREWVWLEVAEVFLAAVNDRVVCYDPDGKRIPGYTELSRTAAAAERKAARAKKRVAAEQARADAAAAERDAEKARADDNARKLAELEAELKRLRGNTDTPNS